MTALRHDWTPEDVHALFDLPFADLMHQAQSVHREHFDANSVQLSTLLSIKTGACPEDCKYCPQSVRYNTGLKTEALMAVEQVEQAARTAKEAGATRFCMGAAWRSPKDRDVDTLIQMIEAVRSQGLETCMTLGMLSESQAERLADAGLDYYNHNLDTSEEHYGEIIGTRTYDDRLETLDNVRKSGMKVCCGGIVGLGETRQDRVGLLRTLANLETHPESVPINQLILMPASHVRLSAGREQMDDALQALCFLAGANSIFYGEQLLTTGNPVTENDRALFERLGIQPEGAQAVEQRRSCQAA